MLGALYRYIRECDPKHFQPMNANFGLLDDLASPVRDKKKKRELFAERAMNEMKAWISVHSIGTKPAEAEARGGPSETIRSGAAQLRRREATPRGPVERDPLAPTPQP